MLSANEEVRIDAAIGNLKGIGMIGTAGADASTKVTVVEEPLVVKFDVAGVILPILRVAGGNVPNWSRAERVRRAILHRQRQLYDQRFLDHRHLGRRVGAGGPDQYLYL